MPQPISEDELRAIVDDEVRSSMGVLTGDLSNERAIAMDYYLGENTGRLRQEDADRSSIVMTTVRDTVEWLMPQLMRMFAQADSVVEFEPVGQDDEEAADQETQAVNHIFWRQNEGFLVLYQWFRDALLQKNGIVKFWLEDKESRQREEYDGVTELKLAELLSDDSVEAMEAEISDTQSITGEPLYRVVFEKRKIEKKVCVFNIPPEEFLISSDARSPNLNGQQPPRFVGHFTQKTESDLREEGFSDEQIAQMKRGSDRWWDEYDQEDLARYHLADEREITHGQYEGHESQRTINVVEAYMSLDMDGDGYAEFLKITRAGDFVQYEPYDHRPFAALTPIILSHKFTGLSVYDLLGDLQEINTAVMRNVLDNMYQTNNMRPVVNDRVSIDDLLVTRPGAPIYVDGELSVQDAIQPFAPQPMWKDGITIMEYLEEIKKDRTGVDETTQGLDPNSLANANTGVVLTAMEAARAKIELIARVFAETGMKWLFRGIHELCRKSYDQPLRLKLRGTYAEVNPQEWRERDDVTVNVGVAAGNKQKEIFALTQIGEMQARMVEGGGLGVTILPSQLYTTAKRMAEALGETNGDDYFMDPMMRMTPQFQQAMQIQMPQPGPDPQMDVLRMTAQVESQKVAVQERRTQVEYAIKTQELKMKADEALLKAQIEELKQQMGMLQQQSKNATDLEKARAQAALKDTENAIKAVGTEFERREAAQKALVDQYRAELQSYTALETKRMELAQKEAESAEKAEAQATSTATTLAKALADATSRIDSIMEEMSKPKPVVRDKSGKVVSIGNRKVTYENGMVKSIG